MKVPDPSFTVSDVKNLIGNRRILEVMNSATQVNAEMTMKDWEDFFMDPDRDGTLLNVISLGNLIMLNVFYCLINILGFFQSSVRQSSSRM